jgi:hypothetical protein
MVVSSCGVENDADSGQTEAKLEIARGGARVECVCSVTLGTGIVTGRVSRAPGGGGGTPGTIERPSELS